MSLDALLVAAAVAVAVVPPPTSILALVVSVSGNELVDVDISTTMRLCRVLM